MANWLTNALDKAKKSLGFKDAGSSEEKCPLKETGLIVVVMKEDHTAAASEGVSGVIVDIKGKSPFNKKTNADGVAAFKPVEPDTYKIKLTLSGGLEKDYDPPMEGSAGVSLGECPVHVVQIVPILNLVTPLLTVDREEARSKAGDAKEVKKDIHVFRPEKTVAKDQPEVIAIKLSYRESHSDIAFDKGGFLAINGAVTLWDDANCKKKIEPKDGRMPFRNDELKSGKTIYMKGEAAGPVNLVFTLENSAKDRVKLEASATKEVKFKINRVTPQITVEHLVVLRDQELWKEQRKNDTLTGSAAVAEAVRIHPDATWIDLAAVQESQHPNYTGKGKLTCSPKNVKFFGNEECTNPFDVDQPIEFAKIAAAKPLRLWLRGEKAGKFNLELKLDAATDPSITVDGPAKGEMGCVELKLKLHHFKKDDVNKAIEPDVADANTFWNQLKGLTLEQAEMTKAERIGTGRTLHVQKDKHHARAKLVVEKIEASHWPDAAKDYAVVLAAADGDKVKKTHSGELKLFNLEEEGVEKVLPHKVKLSDLRSAEQTLWVEGTVACTSWRDRRLSVGFDGPEGGPEKPAKMDGDWAAFTIVEIKEVKIDYTPEANKAVAWDKATKKFCINYKRDPNGRKVTIGAKLSVELADVTVHFMLAPDKDNLKAANSGKDLPATWVWKDIDASVKHKDREDRKKLLHLSAKTDSKGYAKVEVFLSRFGGDKFWPGSYLDQDPHLAKYVHGHADLAKRKPVQSTDTITVWRKFWYQTVKVDGIAAPGFGGAEGQYTSINADMTAATDLNVTRATVNGFNPPAIYPSYMVKINGGNADALVVSDANKGQFFAGYAAETDKPIKIPILVCDAQWDAGGSSAPVTPPGIGPGSFPLDIATDKLVLSPPLQGGNLFVSGTWTAAEWDPTASAGAGGWINVRNGSLTNANLSVNPARDDLHKVTVALPAGVAATTAQTKVWIKNLVIKGANGPYLGESFQHRILAVYESDTPLKIADFQNTIAHEVGHAFHQVIKGDPAGGVAGIPKHPNQKDKGQGNHCRYLTDKCVMYDSGPIAGSLNCYCERCHPYLLVNDFSYIE